MADKDLYRAGIIGCGGIARAHAKGYEEVERTVVVAGSDPSPRQRSKFRRDFNNVVMYADYHKMLSAEELDFVSVCTWPPLHEELVVAAAEAGVKGIVCEKPMAVNLGEADRMLEACDRNGVKLIISHQRRFNRRYAEAKEALDQGKIGELVEVYGSCGGDLLTDGTHNIDLLRYFANDAPIEWVMGQIDRNPWGKVGYTRSERYGHPIESSACARFQFDSGVRGLIDVGEIVTGEYQHITLLGTEGRIEVSGDRYRDSRPTEWRILRAGQEGWVEHPIEEDVNPFACEIEALIRWIEEGGDHLLSGENARADIEVLMAIFESSWRRARVELPLLDISEHPLEMIIKAAAAQ